MILMLTASMMMGLLCVFVMMAIQEMDFHAQVK